MNRILTDYYLSAEQAAFPEQIASSTDRELQAKRRYAAEQNFQRGYALIEALFNSYSRLNVIRIDLEYLRDYRACLSRAKDDFNRFLNNLRHNSIFDAVVGYIWRLEWAVDTGYHYHVMFFVDDSKRNCDWHIAQQIGDYWCRVITEGRGRMHNCNGEKRKYPYLGIGTIPHYDFEKRDVLVNRVLEYLTRVDEELCVPKGTRTFGTSQMPEPHSGLGRPRAAHATEEVRLQVGQPAIGINNI